MYAGSIANCKAHFFTSEDLNPIVQSTTLFNVNFSTTTWNVKICKTYINISSLQAELIIFVISRKKDDFHIIMANFVDTEKN